MNRDIHSLLSKVIVVWREYVIGIIDKKVQVNLTRSGTPDIVTNETIISASSSQKRHYNGLIGSQDSAVLQPVLYL